MSDRRLMILYVDKELGERIVDGTERLPIEKILMLTGATTIVRHFFCNQRQAIGLVLHDPGFRAVSPSIELPAITFW